MITVLVLNPSDSEKLWSVEDIDGDDYLEIRRLVNGNLGSCTLPPFLRRQGYYAYCDDDANVRNDLPAPNGYATHLGQAQLRGPIVILRADETGTEQGLSPEDVLFWTHYLIGPPTPEALDLAIQSDRWWKAHPSGFSIESAEDTQDLLRKLGLAE